MQKTGQPQNHRVSFSLALAFTVAAFLLIPTAASAGEDHDECDDIDMFSYGDHDGCRPPCEYENGTLSIFYGNYDRCKPRCPVDTGAGAIALNYGENKHCRPYCEKDQIPTAAVIGNGDHEHCKPRCEKEYDNNVAHLGNGDHKHCKPRCERNGENPMSYGYRHCKPECERDEPMQSNIFGYKDECVEIPVFPTIAAGMFAVVGGGLAYAAILRRQ